MSGGRRPGRGASAGGGTAPPPRPLTAGDFGGGPFAPVGPELFARYTCLGCRTRAATWAAFLAHRAACRRRALAGRAPAGAPAPGAVPAVAVPDGERDARDPFRTAPPDALRALEGWRRRPEEAAAGAGAR